MKCKCLGTHFREHAIYLRAVLLTNEMLQVVQLLIEKGCQFASRNHEGFTASDYAYTSVSLPRLPQDCTLISLQSHDFVDP